MVINTLKHNYYVIHKLIDENEFEAFLCKDLDEAIQNRYRVMRIKDKELTYKLISIFMELTNNHTFDDYYDCFSKEGCLYIVFANNENPLLTDKLKNEKCDLKERLEIGKKLLERVLLLNMPDFILYDALSENNVTVSSTLDVLFNYNLESIKQFNEIGVKDVTERFLKLFSDLFENEIAMKASIDIKEFIDGLQETQFTNYFELYQKYEALYEKLRDADSLQSIKPNTLIYRIWEKLKHLMRFIKPVLIIAVLGLIACYLIYSIMHKKVASSAVSDFEQIGTVTIQDDDGK